MDPMIDANCTNLVTVCADLSSDQSALIVSDTQTVPIGERLVIAAKAVTDRVVHRVIPRAAMHGEEPPEDVGAEMSEHDVVFGITTMSMTHTQARRDACDRGVRFLSLADYSEGALASPALGTDFRALTPVANRVAEALTAGNELVLRTAAGTLLTCDIRGRASNAAPGWCEKPGDLASPPDAETNVPPLEDGSNGIVIVDGSIPCDEIGLVDSPFTLTIENGRVVKVAGENARVLDELFDRMGNPATRVLGEFGIGLNPNAKLTGYMLEDEGVLGTCHLGIGSNLSFGGLNDVPFHLDHIIRDATITVDGKVIVDGGSIQI